jgi:2,4-dienoyl-CoA reductase-like NADH-dependent reductase (Old Yellow Enzyme family)
MSRLFSSITIRGQEIKNKCWVSPMCQYSSEDGFSNNWHLVHLGSRAAGGAGLVMTEAAAISPEGRISPSDLGIWKDDHIDGLSKITSFIKEMNSIPAIQIAHSGRKGSTHKPWEEGYSVSDNEGGWQPVGPSSIPFDNKSVTPKELSIQEIKDLENKFADSAIRAEKAGFKCIELHMAHGYLVHEFLSPISNTREDDYGGNFENRIKFALNIVKKVRDVISENMILLVRISATDYADNGWDEYQSVDLSKKFKDLGVDLIDCSSGGNYSEQEIIAEPNYQVKFSKKIRKEAEIMTGAVGLITEPSQAEKILESNEADVIFMGRELLRNPYWPLSSMKQLDGNNFPPNQYLRSF